MMKNVLKFNTKCDRLGVLDRSLRPVVKMIASSTLHHDVNTILFETIPFSPLTRHELSVVLQGQTLGSQDESPSAFLYAAS